MIDQNPKTQKRMAKSDDKLLTKRRLHLVVGDNEQQQRSGRRTKEATQVGEFGNAEEMRRRKKFESRK